MRLARSVIHPYDIRGSVPNEIDADAAEHVGRAFVALIKPEKVVVGHDVRLTAKEFHGRVIKGVTLSGADVVDIGQVSTDAFYYACAKRKLPGIMVTASHNPSEYNGFKLVRRIPRLVEAPEIEPYLFDKQYDDASMIGKITNVDIIDDFIDYLMDIVPAVNLRPLKVVIDTSNGAQGPILERMKGRLPITIIPLFFEPDGTFPNHGNDVIQSSNQVALRAAVRGHRADLGLIFDPDGDRCLAVDDRGETVPGDYLTALLASSLLKRQPGGAVVYDIRASDVVPDMVAAAGGQAYAWKVGHVFIKSKMEELGALFGGEVSGHFYFKEFWFADCGLLAGLLLLQYVSALKGGLSEEVIKLEAKYHLSGEINSKVKDVKAVIAKIRQRYSDGEISELDGIAVRYPAWHFVVRPSANEPLLRLTLEATSGDEMERRRDEVLALIRE